MHCVKIKFISKSFRLDHTKYRSLVILFRLTRPTSAIAWLQLYLWREILDKIVIRSYAVRDYIVLHGYVPGDYYIVTGVLLYRSSDAVTSYRMLLYRTRWCYIVTGDAFIARRSGQRLTVKLARKLTSRDLKCDRPWLYFTWIAVLCRDYLRFWYVRSGSLSKNHIYFKKRIDRARGHCKCK